MSSKWNSENKRLRNVTARNSNYTFFAYLTFPTLQISVQEMLIDNVVIENDGGSTSKLFFLNKLVFYTQINGPLCIIVRNWKTIRSCFTYVFKNCREVNFVSLNIIFWRDRQYCDVIGLKVKRYHDFFDNPLSYLLLLKVLSMAIPKNCCPA